MLNFVFILRRRTSPKVRNTPQVPKAVPSRFERDHPRHPTDGNLHTRRLAWRGARDRRERKPRRDGSRRNGEALKCARDQRRDRIGSGEIGSAHTLRRALAHSAIRRAAGGLESVGDCAPQWGKARKQGGKGCRRSQGESAPTTPQK